jgi:hypothetical protein
MRAFADLILALAESVPAGMGSASVGLAIDVTAVELTVPVETHIAKGGDLRACLPRGRLATGFQLPHGRLMASFVASAKRGA